MRDHPVTTLLAFVDSDFDDAAAADLKRAAEGLAISRAHWLLGPPRFVDSVDEDGIRTVGILHRVHHAYDEDGNLLAEEIDGRHLDETRAIVDALTPLTARSGIAIGVELDGRSVGWIEGGEITEDLRVGLLESWAARFA